MFNQSYVLMSLKCTFCGVHVVSAEAAAAQTHNAPLHCYSAANSVIIGDCLLLKWGSNSDWWTPAAAALLQLHKQLSKGWMYRTGPCS